MGTVEGANQDAGKPFGCHLERGVCNRLCWLATFISICKPGVPISDLQVQIGPVHCLIDILWPRSSMYSADHNPIVMFENLCAYPCAWPLYAHRVVCWLGTAVGDFMAMKEYMQSILFEMHMLCIICASLVMRCMVDRHNSEIQSRLAKSQTSRYCVDMSMVKSSPDMLFNLLSILKDALKELDPPSFCNLLHLLISWKGTIMRSSVSS